ncbi:MAG: ArnT family glycosyltransferase [Candidatus Binatia bacterium]
MSETVKRYVRVGIVVALIVAFFLAMTINLESTPPLWWDEGWTLTVARTWVEQGHYGRLLMGQLAPPGLEAALPVTAAVALSFKLFGVGVWQGRMVGVVFALGAFALLYHLTSKVYQPKTAAIALASSILLAPHFECHPIFSGRQVLAEMPALFYILAGYCFFLSGLCRSFWFFPFAMLSWGIALFTKLQVIPFLLFSLTVPIIISGLYRQRRNAALWGMGLLGSFLTWQGLLVLRQLFMQNYSFPPTPVPGIYEVTAFVPLVYVRFTALILSLFFGLSALLGQAYAVGKLVVNWEKESKDVDLAMIRISLLVLASSWFAWYTLFSSGFRRYLLQPLFLSSIFVALMIQVIGRNVILPMLAIEHASSSWVFRYGRKTFCSIMVLAIVVLTAGRTLQILYQTYRWKGMEIQIVTAFLNTSTSPRSLIETYDPELFFFLDRPYHYPSDQVHIELIRRISLKQDVPIPYDPLAANPDYLVVGPFSKVWQLYDAVLARGEFRQVLSTNRYKVYERIR